jgi:hypothetical protein
MIDLGSRVVANSTILSSELDAEIVLMDVGSGNYYNLEAVGREIWRALKQPTLVSDLCERLVASYDAPEDRIRSTVLKFLGQLQEHALIAVV